MAIKSEMHVGKVLREYIVEYLHVTAKGHNLKGYKVMAGSKAEAINLCPKMTITGRVKEVGEVLSCLKEVANVENLKSDRGCRVF